MKRNVFLLTLAAVLLVGCGKHAGSPTGIEHFTTEVRLKTTPVKEQGRSDLCWDYAMLATIETEHLMQGDSVNLSTDFVARMLIQEEASEMFYTHKGRINTRGMMTMVPRLLATYGLTHYDAYHSSEATDYHLTERKVAQAVRTAMSYEQMSSRVNEILDKEIGACMPKVFMLGAVYTPLEFAHSVCHEDEYIAYTSFTHHLFGQAFPLETPDNHYHDTFLNVPIDTLMNIMEQSVRHGHPVCWEGDISEPGFSFEKGVADISTPLPADVQKERQREFNNHQTTDDHCMEIVGIAHNHQGRKFFIMKNSWGTANPYHGFMYVSFDYVRLKTIAIMAKNV